MSASAPSTASRPPWSVPPERSAEPPAAIPMAKHSCSLGFLRKLPVGKWGSYRMSKLTSGFLLLLLCSCAEAPNDMTNSTLAATETGCTPIPERNVQRRVQLSSCPKGYEQLAPGEAERLAREAAQTASASSREVLSSPEPQTAIEVSSVVRLIQLKPAEQALQFDKPLAGRDSQRPPQGTMGRM